MRAERAVGVGWVSPTGLGGDSSSGGGEGERVQRERCSHVAERAAKRRATRPATPPSPTFAELLTHRLS